MGPVFAKTLISWYLKNCRDLPWRQTTDPYKVWLSEIILQQTRVDQGLSYYYKFITAFPNVKSLAKAKEDQVLKLWQGLGYYSRARNIKKTAEIVTIMHGGVFPNNRAELMKLPGIGPYTASAIASFCSKEVTPVIDGNVYRFLSRFFGIMTPIDSSGARAIFEELAMQLIDKKQPDVFNQAIMEFGALQCTPKSTDCQCCVFKSSCYAYSKKMVAELPVKKQKQKVKSVYFDYFIIRIKNQLYLNKRTGKGIWENLFQFPLIENDVAFTENQIMKDKEFKAMFKNASLVIDKISPQITHVLSHRKILCRFWEVRIKKESLVLKSQIRIDKSQLHSYAVPKLIERYLNGG